MEKVIIAQLSVKEEDIDQFKSLAEIVIQKTRQEPGCLTYRLLNDCEQSGEFVFYEKYTDQEAVEIHSSSDYLKAFLNSVTDLLKKEPTIDVY